MATINSWGSALPAQVSKGGQGNSSLTSHSILVGQGTSSVNQVGPGTNGQVLVGVTSSDPTFITPTAGTGISVTTNATTLSYALNSPVAIANGGTNATSMSNTDGVCYFDGTLINTTSVGSAGQILTSNGSGVAPSFQTGGGSTISITGDTGGTLTSGSFTFAGGTTGLSFGGSGTTETLTFAGITANGGVVNLGTDNASNAINIGTGTTARAIHIGDSAAAHVITVGSTSGAAALTLNSGSAGIIMTGVEGVTVANKNYVTINTSTGALGSDSGGGGSSFTWSVITADQNASVNNGYICNKSGLLTLTLPTTAAVGSIIEVTGINTALGWKIAQNASGFINFGSVVTTTGTGGSLASSATNDAVRIVCTVANNGWLVLSCQGNVTYV